MTDNKTQCNRHNNQGNFTVEPFNDQILCPFCPETGQWQPVAQTGQSTKNVSTWAQANARWNDHRSKLQVPASSGLWPHRPKNDAGKSRSGRVLPQRCSHNESLSQPVRSANDTCTNRPLWQKGAQKGRNGYWASGCVPVYLRCTWLVAGTCRVLFLGLPGRLE